MRQRPERLAWTVLLSAFAAFCLIAVGSPLTVRSYLRNARQPLHVQINSQRGTVRVARGASSQINAISQDASDPIQLFKGDRVLTGDFSEGLLSLQRGEPKDRETLGTVVIYDNSTVNLIDAYSPRFAFSSNTHRGIVAVAEGKVGIEVHSSNDNRSMQMEVRSDHVSASLGVGSYAVEANNQRTTITVRDGQATVRADGKDLVLQTGQRAIALGSGELDGPLPAEHNLIINGDFTHGIDKSWLEYPDDPSARVFKASEDGQSFVWFQHDQAQPSEVGLVQTLNNNVKDLESLVVYIKLRINYHSLSVCGSQGSECPVMVRIDYIDAVGGNRQWVHGFYAFEDPAQGGQLPYYCLTCPEPSSGDHTRVPEKVWFHYLSPNLMAIEPPEFRPTQIRSVRVYASGHSYDSMVTDVELLAEE
jgi:hypothetical protein